MFDIILLLALLVFVVSVGVMTLYRDDRGAAKDALRQALESGEITPDDYAAGIRAMDEAA